MRKLRFAIIGIEHIHARGIYPEFKDITDVVGIADYKAPKESVEILSKENIPDGIKVWDDYKELLAQDLDLVLVCTNVKDHADITCELLERGIHVMVEKPMTLTMADAKRMYRAYKKSKAELIISWPIAWFSAFNKVKELADSGAVGKVQKVQYRSPSTRGAFPVGKYTPEELSKLWWYQKELGGGSISDYAGYGCVLATWITGKTAKRVFGLKKNFFLPFSDVEDYSALTIDFGDCVGFTEGSWSTMSNGQIPTGPIVYGSEGVIVTDRFSDTVKVYKTYKPYVPTPNPEYVYETHKTDDLAKNVINFLTKGEPLHEMITADFNMKVMAAIDAGIRSCDSGVFEEAEDPFGL